MNRNEEIKIEALKIKHHRKMLKPRINKKKFELLKHRDTLLMLHYVGKVSYRDLSLWLKVRHNVEISHTSIRKYLNEEV